MKTASAESPWAKIVRVLEKDKTFFPSPTVARNFFGSKSSFLTDMMCRERWGTLFLAILTTQLHTLLVWGLYEGYFAPMCGSVHAR
jgi:hypothetical protein